MVNLSSIDYGELQQQGYSPAEINEALKELEAEELQGAYQKTTHQQQDPRISASHSNFGAKPDENLIKFQLELNDILEKAEHILRGDRIEFENGHMIWKPNKHPERNTLNDEGVQEIMKELALYINRNTILSDFTAEEINAKVLDFGKALNNLVFMRYEEMGIDTEDKRKNYPMLVLSVVDMVHSSLARAKDGAERTSLREARQVSQTDQLNPNININTAAQQKKSIFNPARWF